MANDPKKPGVDDLIVDATDLQDFLEDLEEGELQGLQGEGENTPGAIKEISDNQAAVGVHLGITQKEIDDLNELDHKIKRIDVLYPTVRKLYEKMRETRAKLVDIRGRKIGTVIKIVRTRNNEKEHKGVLAKYETAEKCYSSAAQKAVRTRQQNKKDKSTT